MVIQVAFTIPESTREYEVRSIACAKAGGYMLQGGCFTGLERIYFIDETIKIKVSNGDIFEIND